MSKCLVVGCEREAVTAGMCSMDYQRQRHPGRVPHILRSDNLRRVKLDDVAVNWLLAIFEKLPAKGQ